jgi:FemAB-related protein (PEP-CTERM system-associated)
VTQTNDSQWDEFVRQHPDGEIFHLSGWKRVAEDVFGHRPHFLSVQRNGQLSAVLPLVEVRSYLFGHALISNAFCVGGGPLSLDAESRAEILAQAEALGRRLGVDYVELRDTPDTPSHWTPSTDIYAGFAAPIAADEEDNLKQIPRKQRAVVRKALGRGMSVTIDRSPSDFFDLYARTMRDHGTPSLPKRFFECLMEVFGADCEILTVHHEGRAVSSVLSYFFKDKVLPYYTGSGSSARATGSNDLMYWSLMRRAVERGYGTFDFGRSKLGSGPYGFKCNWGFEPRPISHQFLLLKSRSLPNLNPNNPKYRIFIKAWRRLPIAVATSVAPLLSRILA